MSMNIIQLTSIIYLTLGILILLLGILIFRENPNRRINRVTGTMMFFAALAPIMGAFSMLIQQVPAANELDLSLFYKLYLFWEFFFPQLLLFSLIFPKETNIIHNYQRVTPLIYVPHLIQITIILLFQNPESILALTEFTDTGSGIFLQPLFMIFNLLLTLLSLIHEFHDNIFALINIIYVILAMLIMYRGYKELKSPRLKNQVTIVLWGIRISVGLYVVAVLLPKLLSIQLSEIFVYALIFSALIIGPVSIAIAIIKYQFLNIRMILRRGIIFSMTSGLLVGTYLVIYSQAKQIFNSILGVDIPAIEIIFLIFAIIFFQPILSFIEKIVEKLFEQEKIDYRNTMQALSHNLLHIIEIDKLKQKVIYSLKDIMMVESVKLILKTKDSHYIIEPPNSKLLNENIFSKNSQFIELMSCIEDPVNLNEINARITDSNELNLLKNTNTELFFPLCHHDSLNGILCIGKKINNSKLTSEDISNLNVLSDQIALALENTELYEEKIEKQRIEEELSLTSEIQRMLLPHQIPQSNFFEISALNIPSKEVGGDYYDFVNIENKKIGVVIGDISGKGIPGAILMSNLQATFRAISADSSSTSKVTYKINNQIANTTSSEKFATFFYGIIDYNNYTLTYTNAGHNYPIHRQANNKCSYLVDSGLVIGVSKNYNYLEKRIKLKKGDFIILYTDGITEAINSQHDEFSDQHLLDIVCKSNATSAEELRNQIYEDLINFTKGISQYDDITLLVIQLI